jgi:predicted transcriptional regulator
VSERKNNRGKIEIMADVLGLSTVGIKKTHIMYRANLSYEQISYYLSELQAHDLLEQAMDDDSPVYRTTEKGRAFLHHFGRMAELMNGYAPQEPEKVSLLA